MTHPDSTASVLTSPRADAAEPPRHIGDKVFRGIATGAGVTIAVTLGAVALFLIVQAWPALTHSGLKIRAMGSAEPVSVVQLILPQLFGTVLGSALALIIAVPLSVAIALLITQYAPSQLATPLGYIVDLLAAVPSVVYGLWGGLWLLPHLTPIYHFLNQHFSWIPLFAGTPSPTGRVLASAAIIMTVMIIPIITAITRDVFALTPNLMIEAAEALGATRWETIRLAVLPYGRSGIVSASMLGLGRALGETMAVVMVLSVGAQMSWKILEGGVHSTIAANIALQFPEASGDTMSALIATGLALFVITTVVTIVARRAVTRSYTGGKK